MPITSTHDRACVAEFRVGATKRCGRCNAETTEGFLCVSCSSFLSRLGANHPSLPSMPAPVGIPAVPSRRSSVATKVGGVWWELEFVDGKMVVGIQTNELGLLTRFLSTSILDCNWNGTSNHEHRYSIEAPSRIGGARYVLRTGDRRVDTASNPEGVVLRLQAHLHSQIARTSINGIFVHAKVLLWKKMTLVLPGLASMPLVCELSQRGAIIVASEYAVFDRDGLVHPFPRRPEILPAAMILFSACAPANSRQLRPMTPGEALLGLLGNSVSAHMSPHEALQWLCRAVIRTPSFESSRGEERHAADAVRRLYGTAAIDTQRGFTQ